MLSPLDLPKDDVTSSTTISKSMSSSSSPMSSREVKSPLSSKDASSPCSSKDITSPTSFKDLKSPLSSKDISSPESKETPISPLSTTSSLKSPDSTTFLPSNSPEDSSAKINVNPTRTRSTSNNSSIGQCKICGDKSEETYHGVMTCDSCKGFFKRAIKNSRKYTCISTRDCVLIKKTRNHCKACRLARCYKVGMQKDVVEDEVAREKKEKLEKRKQEKLQKESSSSEVSSSLSELQVQTIDLKIINSAELFVDPKINNFANSTVDPIRQLCLAADKQLASLAEWAKRLPFFTELVVMDQVKLLQWNWAELLIGGFCYRSSAVSDGILLATGLHLSRENLQKAGVGTVVNKLFGEVINKMQKLQIDVSEWGCLRAMMLFAPDTKELNDVEKVESIRDRYIATLCEYEERTYPNDPDRLGNLLLRLPPLKAIALQVLEHLFFFKLIGDVPIDTFLLEMLDVDNH